jgi:pyruvate, orthophosphate dikinase
LGAQAALPGPFNLLNEEVINKAIAKKELMLKKVKELYEVNPMLGHRGVRLGMSYPEIYQMQIRSILEAAALCAKQSTPILPEIMVPQVITVQELIKVKSYVDQIQQEVERQHGIRLEFKFGTMVETVRACTRAGELAEVAEFFSFGTNDLTQATFSFSREDAENKFLPLYNDTGLLEDNPFEVLDAKGVGQLMKMTAESGHRTRPDIKIGICGEQGGHPQSIRFCHHIKLDYVSCSAPRIPIAKLAVAHAKLLEDDYRII